MKSKLALAIVALLLGLGIPAYFLFTGGTTGNVVVVQPSSETEALFVSLASQLVPLTFNTSILSDARFKALVDLHTPIIAEQKGRKDPFAVLGR